MKTRKHFLLLIFSISVLCFYGCRKEKIQKNIVYNVHGYCDPQFAKVKEEFTKNFQERGDVGAACAVYFRGEKVVDLWGGYSNPFSLDEWKENTMVMVFSTSKGLSAMTLAMAHSNGWLDYDEKVTTYWPEFAQNGKDDITVRQLLSHEAGLCLIDTVFKVEKVAHLDSISEILARQKPIWEPGTKHGYHLSTIGFYMNELLRRVDPEQRSIGVFLQEELAQPFDFEFYIGLPDTVKEERIAPIILPSVWDGILNFDGMPRATRRKFYKRNSILSQSVKIPKNFYPNGETTQSVELPSANGIGTARAVAKAYSLFADGGDRIGLSKNTFLELIKPAGIPPEGSMDEVVGIDTYYSLGFLKPGPDVEFGSSTTAFGTPGAGGSFGFADPDKNLSFAYVMSKMGAYLKDDPREVALRDAVYESIRIIEMKEKAIMNSASQ